MACLNLDLGVLNGSLFYALYSDLSRYELGYYRIRKFAIFSYCRIYVQQHRPSEFPKNPLVFSFFLPFMYIACYESHTGTVLRQDNNDFKFAGSFTHRIREMESRTSFLVSPSEFVFSISPQSLFRLKNGMYKKNLKNSRTKMRGGLQSEQIHIEIKTNL